MLNPSPPRPPRLVAEALGTGAIPAELSAILAARFQMVREDEEEITWDKRSDRDIQSYLVKLVLGVELIPGLELVTLVRVDLDRIVHLMHSLFSVWVNTYSTS